MTRYHPLLQTHRPPALRWWPRLADLPGLCIFALASLALDVVCLRDWNMVHESFSLFWPSAGLAVAILLRFGRQFWPAVALTGTVAFHVAGVALFPALLMATGSTAQALLACICLTQFRQASPQLETLRDWSRLVLFGAFLAPMLGATLAGLGLMLADVKGMPSLPMAWLSWWAGSALGIVVVAPLTLTWLASWRSEHVRLLRWLIAATWLVFSFAVGGSITTSYLLIPLGIGAAILGGRRLATIFAAGLMAIALLRPDSLSSLFDNDSLLFDQLHRWLFYIVLTLTTQGLAILLHERNRVVDALRHSQKRVAESEANLLSIAQAPTSLIWMSGRDGQLSWCNDIWLKFTGQDKTAAQQNGFVAAVHPDDRAYAIQRYIDAFTQRQAVQIECRLRNERGNYHRMLCNCAPRHNADGRFLGFVGVCIDVTPEREATEQLRSQEQLIRGIYEHSDIGIAVLGNEGDLLHHNTRFTSMFGWSKEDFNVLGYAALLHPAERESGLRGLAAVLGGEVERVDVEHRYLRKDGSEFWGHLNCRPMFNQQNEQVGIVGTFIDVTARRQAEQRVQLTAKVFEACNEGVMITDGANRILEVNQAFTAITGYLPAEVLGHTPRLLSSGRHSANYYAAMWATLSKEGRWSGEIWNRRRDGTEFPEWLSLSVVRDENGTVTHHVGVFSDITERKQVEARVRKLAQYDFLTKLPNRALMYDRLRQIHATASRYEKRYAVIFVDLDNFKPINDQLGHDAGDALLCQVADRLKSNLRVADTPARYGGDEFVVLVPEISDMHEVRVIAEKLSSALRQPYLIKQQLVSVTPSIGIALYPDHALDPDDLIRVADQAMYDVKSNGRNGLAFYSRGSSLPN